MTQESIQLLKLQLYQALETQRSCGVNIKKEDLERFVDTQVMFIPDVTNEEKESIKNYLESHIFVKHDHDGILIVDEENKEDREWYTKNSHDNEHFWKLYKKYLIQEGSLDFASLNKMDEVTLPRIMNCLGNPTDELASQRVRYGLVIGDVQSGKTSTYGGLICKAADAGMKVVILLAGQTETLRQQTQERMEEDIVGYTIRLNDDKKPYDIRVGVGCLKGYKPIVAAHTSYEDDFKVGHDRTMSTLEAQSSLVMFIVKKNVPVLKRLYSWLTNKKQTKNAQGKLPFSLLLIDDEADYASINTNKPDCDPTQTNAIIRKLVEAFMNSNYVGFTATPFANIFIRPEKDDSMETTDLFPKDFIYVLPTPDAYIGALRIFAEPDEKNPSYGDRSYMLKYITDIEEPSRIDIANFTDEERVSRMLYYKHKTDWRGLLPKSLDNALKCFYLANVIRDLDDAKSAPRTMLINISRFKDVHSFIKRELAKQVEADYNEINCNFSGNQTKDKKLPLYIQLSELFDNHYLSSGYKKSVVLKKKNLLSAIEKIRVIVVNGTKESKEDAPDYKSNPSQRIIAVGGLALSRGLTLKGLITSYFYRNTATYDTLMQMGRWFGYRPKYDRLCQIWITNSSANWYREIACSTEELKNELLKMNKDKLTPREFGLRVRHDDTALEITARNKMMSAQPVREIVSFWGNIFETPYFSTDVDSNKQNVNAVNKLIDLIIASGGTFSKAGRGASLISENVSSESIVDFLSTISVSSFNRRFPLDNIIENIEKSVQDSDELKNWDVALVGGSGPEYEIKTGMKLRKVMRTISEWNGKVFAFTNHGVVGGNNDGKIGLDNPDEVLKEYLMLEKKNSTNEPKINNRTWFKYASRKPILLIYQVFPKNIETAEKGLKQYFKKNEDNPILGFGIGFPGYGHPESEEHEYYINIVYQKSLEDEDEEIDDIDLD